MFNFFKKKNKDKAAQETTPTPTTVAAKATTPETPATKAIKLYTIALDQSCKMARELLDGRALAYEEIDVTGNGSLISWLRRETGEVTFPRVFIYNKHIGGYEQLRSMEYSGALERLLRGEGIDEFLKAEEQQPTGEEWTLERISEQLRAGKILSLKREDGVELLTWAEIFANPPAIFYEGKKYPISEFDRILSEIVSMIEQGEVSCDWTEED
ncbi:MAG: glutaredoxin [Acidobacteriota bacterium]